jgi:hypothetical protein
MPTDRNCVCGYPKSRHTGADLKCPDKTGRTFGTRELPAGKTCQDCRYFKRTCEWLISCEPTRTDCDWYPIRFVPRPAPVEPDPQTDGGLPFTAADQRQLEAIADYAEGRLKGDPA